MRAVLDANVLFSTILREILTDLAGAGVYTALWSDRILEEWRRAAARLGADQDAVAGAEISMLRLNFAQARIADAAPIDIDLPDPADRHVVETALAGHAAQIVTANLRDFPQHSMQRLGLRAIHPDAFLLQLHDVAPDQVSAAAQSARDKAARMGGEMPLAEMLKRSRLPRLAKRLKG